MQSVAVISNVKLSEVLSSGSVPVTVTVWVPGDVETPDVRPVNLSLLLYGSIESFKWPRCKAAGVLVW